MHRESWEEEEERAWVAGDRPCHSLSLPCISSLSGRSQPRQILPL